MNRSKNHDAHLAARRDRYEHKAAKLAKDADSAMKSSKAISDFIPFGQPILVGHHSESRHRRDAKRITDRIHKGIELERKSDHYATKADSVGKAGIRSDDENALIKLNEKLNALEKQRDSFKIINNICHKNTAETAINMLTERKDLALSESTIEHLVYPHPYTKGNNTNEERRRRLSGIDPTNINAKIRDVKKRIETK